MIAAMLLGAVAGTSVGLLQGAGPGPTAPAQAATAAPPSSTHAAAAPHPAASSSRSSGGTAEQRLSAPRRQLDRGVKAGKVKQVKQKEPGDSEKRSHDKGKGRQAHDH